jgi:hypothetical protein
MKLRALALSLFFIPTVDGMCQTRETVTQPIEWMAITNTFQVQKNWIVLMEGQFRYAGSFDPMQFQARFAAERQLEKGFSIVPFGYVYTWNPLYGEQPNEFVNNEQRIWQQAGLKHQSGRVHFNHRLRLEQRFLQVHLVQNGDVVDQGYDQYMNRIRYRFQIQVPLNKNEITASTWFASVADELFASWGKQVSYQGPDQNRVYAGLGYQFTRQTSLQGGFNYQVLIKAGGTKQENNVGFLVHLNYNVSLLKKG